ncbi:LHFPL tetraspan subfamily member 3 protein [Polyodon spathula]|uniref:LHFPL tetraspan subfamily member 3 protein n=1 Tax=Polyodon spathula TaxID=7913 RepID=UPI001B7EEE8D|nr:LHFPL tetraspan subfamily member 3 protein [Polyodon spathula]
MQPRPPEVASLYQTEFTRSARAVGVLWGVCTLCFAVIEVVILIQPSWVGTGEIHYHPDEYQRPQLQPPASGSLGLYEVCVETDWLVPDCRGSVSSLAPIPAFQSAAVFVCMSLVLVWISVGCLALFRFCNSATVYKICAWLQLCAGFCLALSCLVFPDSWDAPEMRFLCGDEVGSFSLGRCSVHWAFILAILGVLDALILSTLAFVLGNRQDALLPSSAPPNKNGTRHLLVT